MERSRDRILTTHVGSLPRPPEVMEVLTIQDRGESTPGNLHEVLSRAVLDTVQRQVATGIDVVGDGEMSKISYSTYIRHRFSGFVVGSVPSALPKDVEQFPGLRQRVSEPQSRRTYTRSICRGPIATMSIEPLQADIARLHSAVDGTMAREAFMSAASPATVAMFHPDEHYHSADRYLEALAEAMRSEYEAIADAGFIVQVDSPDLAMGRHYWFKDVSSSSFLRSAAAQVEVLNHALRNVSPERSRIHICWGNYEGPHTCDIPLRRVLPILMKVRPAAVLVEAANPRHEHEWPLWKHVLPDDKILVPGVIDTTTNIVEHPELVAQRIRRFARMVGRERVIAGTDCGFATFAGAATVFPEVCWAKLASLREGANRASRSLWRRAA